MNTTEVAGRLGTTPRLLRQFLRSAVSTFVAVGSGSRYEFTEDEVPTLERRFAEWSKGTTNRKRPKVATTPVAPRQRAATTTQAERDAEVWAEEGPVVMGDIRDPRVRATVRAEANRQEARLEMLMMRAGLHISQGGWDRNRRRG